MISVVFIVSSLPLISIYSSDDDNKNESLHDMVDSLNNTSDRGLFDRLREVIGICTFITSVSGRPLVDLDA